jgi:site-specific recombinase XerD
VCEHSGLGSTFRFHDLRHTCATLLLKQGVHVKFVQELLGHDDVSLTLNVYSHVPWVGLTPKSSAIFSSVSPARRRSAIISVRTPEPEMTGRPKP